MNNNSNHPRVALVRQSLVALGGLVVLALYLPAGAQVKVAAGDVKDTRRSDGFFNRLEVELRITGEILTQAKGVRVTVDKAIDDTGKNLISEKESEKDFKEIGPYEKEEHKVEVTLTNPERRAERIQVIAGNVEFFVPQRDPRSTITIANFQRNAGEPISNAGLKPAGIEITLWTKDIFDARKKAEEEKLTSELEAKAKKAEESGRVEDALGVLAEGLAQAFGSMFSSFSEMDESDVAFYIKDPGSKLIRIEFEDENGSPLEHGGRMTMGSDPRTVIYNFEQKPPPTARIKLYVMTPGSVARFPFSLTNVSLP